MHYYIRIDDGSRQGRVSGGEHEAVLHPQLLLPHVGLHLEVPLQEQMYKHFLR